MDMAVVIDKISWQDLFMGYFYLIFMGEGAEPDYPERWFYYYYS